MKPQQIFQAAYRHLPLICFAIAGGFYFSTMAPTFIHTDSGELASVQATLGIAHPTGYPLFTLLGWIFSRVPIADPVDRLNFLSLLFTSGGLFFFARAVMEFVRRFRTRKSADGEDPDLIAGNFFTVLAATFFLAFSRTFWLQSTSVEVYSLHILLSSLLLFQAIRAWFAPEDAIKPWFLLALVLGLGFTNHMTTLLWVPGMVWLFLARHGLRPFPWKRAGLMTAVFGGVLLLLYSYLPIRAGMDPLINWGDPTTLEKIRHHVSGKQFQTWMFAGTEVAAKNLGHFFAGNKISGMPGLLGEFQYIALLFAVPGFVYIWRLQRKIAVFWLITIIFSIGWVINYSIKDLDPYYLSVYLLLAFAAGMGVRYVWLRMQVSRTWKWAATGIAILGVCLEIGLNYGKVDESGNWLYDDYSRAALESLPRDAVVITHQWDFFVSPAWYLQAVEGFRPDVRIVEYEMLRSRHWYVNRLRRVAPELTEALGQNLTRFEEEVAKFDLGKKYSVGVLSTTFDQLFGDLIRLSAKRPVYIAPEMVYQTMKRDQIVIPPGFTLVPEELFFRVLPIAEGQQYTPLKPFELTLRFPEHDNYYVETIRHQVAVMASDRARYELSFQHPENAKRMVGRIRKYHPDFQLPPILSGL